MDAAEKMPVKSTPFVLYVGNKDDFYPVMLLKPMIDRLRAMRYQIDLREKRMDHCLNGQLGVSGDVEENWIKHYIEDMVQDSTLGAIQKSDSAAPLLDSKDDEIAVKVVYSLLFGNKVPYNRKAEIMKHSCWEAAMSDMNKRVNKLSEYRS